jgi:hypothetical protein
MSMEFSAQSILMVLFTGAITGLASYFGAYTKVKAEVRAATEDLKQTIRNLAETTRAVEIEKARVGAMTSRDTDKRKAIYSLAVATESLIHSMCWLSWDAKTRRSVRQELTRMYDAEAHKLLPEIFSQLALLHILDEELHANAYPFAWRLAGLDVKFGEAIVIADTDNAAGTERLTRLFGESIALQLDIDSLFGGKLKAYELEKQAGVVNAATT